jgi:branched-chain amino acid transport system permease protein
LPALVETGVLGFMTSQQASTMRFILVGIGLILLIVFRPQGILGNKKELTFVKQ